MSAAGRRPPDFDELVGKDVPAAERERLRHVHELLVAAGPPPELTPELAHPPRPAATVTFLPRRRRTALAVLAAALAAIAFGAGYLVHGQEEQQFATSRVVRLAGTSFAPEARGSLLVGKRDAAGNWPMLLKVRDLPRLSGKGYYEVLLTRNGKRVGPCGSFLVKGETTTVRLNAPYKLGPGVGWVIAVHPKRHLEHPPLAMRMV